MQDHTELGPFLLAISFALLTPLLIPATLVIVPTGLIMQRVFEEKWKAILIGTLTSFLGLWIGSLISFLIGRYIMRDLTQRLNGKYKIMKALDLVLMDEGLKFCVLLRLCPVVPFNVLNYVLGGTSISFKDYSIGGFGYIPVCTAYTFLGTTIGDITQLIEGNYDQGTTSIVLLIVGCILTVFLVVYITFVVRRYLKRTAEKIELEN